MSPLPLLPLLVWATVAGLDLASLLQGLLNRPLVAGAVAGIILGDPAAGLRIGAVLELFALEVLPVGAARYPDYGAASVAAVAFGAAQPWAVALGPAVLLGLALGQLGGWTLVGQRRVTAWAVRQLAEPLDRGDSGIAVRLHLLGLASDLVRSAGLAALGLLLATLLARSNPLDAGTARVLGVVVVAGGFMALIGGALRRAGSVRRIGWLVAGLALSTAVVALR